MLDNYSLLEMIKQAAIDAVNAQSPCDYVYGKVASASPLEIQIDQKLMLTYHQIAKMAGLPVLKKGDKVILLRKCGGQEFLLMGKAV